MKIKPFLSKPVSYIFIGTVILAQPYWILEIYANFAYFHGINNLFLSTRPYEALCRDPWWIFTTVFLFWVIKTQYEMTLKDIIRISPRFGIMLLAMVLSIVFIVLDILSVTKAIRLAGKVGINPFWKLAFVFKCLTDAVVLDDFKVALDRLRAFRISRLGSFSGDMSDSRSRTGNNLVATWEEAEREANALQAVRSPDGAFVHPSNFPLKPKRARRPQKDSVVLPPDYFHDVNAGRDPEDIVPSALEENYSSTEKHAPPLQKSHGRHHYDNVSAAESDEMLAEADYANALRDVQRRSETTSRTTSDTPRQPTGT